MRDRLIHHEFGVLLEMVWDIVENHPLIVNREVRKALETFSH